MMCGLWAQRQMQIFLPYVTVLTYFSWPAHACLNGQCDDVTEITFSINE
jgi:hypothetical protein